MLKARRQRLLHSYPKKAGAGLTARSNISIKIIPPVLTQDKTERSRYASIRKKIKIVHMETFTTVYALAVQIKEAYGSVQGNLDQCKMLHDQVQHVIETLKAMPGTTKRKPEVKVAVSSLPETLSSCLNLMGEFTMAHSIKKAVSSTSRFDALLAELDRVLKVCKIQVCNIFQNYN